MLVTPTLHLQAGLPIISPTNILRLPSVQILKPAILSRIRPRRVPTARARAMVRQH